MTVPTPGGVDPGGVFPTNPLITPPEPDAFPEDTPDPVAEDPGILDDPGAPVDEEEDTEDGGGGGGGKKVTEDQSPAAKPKGATKDQPGLLRGGEIMKIKVEDGEDLWFVQYEYPPGSGNYYAYQFDSLEQVYATIGEDFATSGKWTIKVRDERHLTRDTFTVVDDATDVIGIEGNFQNLMNTAMRQAAEDAGITDPGILGQFLADPEIQEIIAVGAMGDWSADRITAEIRNTGFYQEVMYPGISVFLAEGASDPEGEWVRYANSVAEGLKELGVTPDSDGSFKSSIGILLEGGVDDGNFLEMVPTFIKANQSAAYRDALNQWTEAELGKNVTFDDIYDIMAGTVPEDMRETVERANLTYYSGQRDLQLDDKVVKRIARETDLTEQEIAANFTDLELQMMALGDKGLKNAGLSTRALALAAFGQETKFGTAAETIQAANKFALERGMLDDPKAQLFLGFDERGRPVRPGAAGLSPVSG